MQDPKLLNIGTSVRNGKVYSVEFHEDDHYGHIKRVNRDGTSDYFAFNSASPTPSNRYENYSDSGNVTQTALADTEYKITFDGNGSFEDTRFSPQWVTHPLYNTTLGKIDLTDVPVGTLVHVTYDLILLPSQSNEEAHIYLKFGAFGGYKMFDFDGSMRNQNESHHYSGTKTFFVINEDLQQNGVELCVETSCDTEVVPQFIMIALI